MGDDPVSGECDGIPVGGAVTRPVHGGRQTRLVPSAVPGEDFTDTEGALAAEESSQLQEPTPTESGHASRAPTGSFSAVLQQTLHAKGRSVTWLANEMRVPRATLQTWLTRGRVPRTALDRLLAAAELGLTREELARDYDVALTRWERKPAARVTTEQQGRDAGGVADVQSAPDRYLELIKSLEPGDMLVSVVCDGLPPEVGEALVTMAPPVRQRAIVAALERGAFVLYMVPSAEQRAAWELGLQGAHNERIARVEGTLRWWVDSVTCSTVARTRACVIGVANSPIFVLGQHFSAKLKRNGDSLAFVTGRLFTETAFSTYAEAHHPSSVGDAIARLAVKHDCFAR